MQGSHGRVVAQIPRILNEAGQHAELREMLERSIREHSATSEMLAWLCSERDRWRELITPDLLGAIFAAPGTRTIPQRRIARPRQQVAPRACLRIGNWLGTFLRTQMSVIARDAMRRLQLSPLFDELTKRSLLARIVKVLPGAWKA